MALPKADVTGFTNEQFKAFQNAAALGSGVEVTDNGNTYTVDSTTGPRTITPSSLAPTNPISLNKPKDTNNYGGDIAGGLATIGVNTATLTHVDTGKTGDSEFQDFIKSLGTPPSATATYNTGYASSGIDQAQAVANVDSAAEVQARGEFDAINAQLAGLSAEQEAQKLRSEGRLAPMSAIYGEQQATDRAYAIKALPLQAQALAAQAKVAQAQGKSALSQSILNQVQNRFDRLYDIQMKNAENQYNYRTNIIEKVYEYADKKERAKLDEQKTQNATNMSLYNSLVSDARSASASATSNGQANVAAQFAQIVSGLNPASKTFAQDYAKAQETFASLQGQITPKGGGTGNTTKTFTYGGKVYSYQVDSTGNPLTAPQEVTDASTRIGGNVTKGNLSDANFVERALNDKGVSYQDALDKIPEGKVGVIQNSTGEIGAIDPEEYDPKLYTYL